MSHFITVLQWRTIFLYTFGCFITLKDEVSVHCVKEKVSDSVQSGSHQLLNFMFFSICQRLLFFSRFRWPHLGRESKNFWKSTIHHKTIRVFSKSRVSFGMPKDQRNIDDRSINRLIFFFLNFAITCDLFLVHTHLTLSAFCGLYHLFS